MRFLTTGQFRCEVLAERLLIELAVACERDGNGPGRDDGNRERHTPLRLEQRKPAPLAVPPHQRPERDEGDSPSHRALYQKGSRPSPPSPPNKPPPGAGSLRV